MYKHHPPYFNPYVPCCNQEAPLQGICPPGYMSYGIIPYHNHYSPINSSQYLQDRSYWEGIAQLSDELQREILYKLLPPIGNKIRECLWKSIRVDTISVDQDNLWSVGIYSPDGQFIALGNYNGQIILYDAISKKEVKTLGDPVSMGRNNVTCLSYRRDGRWLASGYTDGTVTIWDTESVLAIQHFTNEGNSVQSISYHPTGEYIATGYMSGVVKIWKVETGDELYTLVDRASPVNSLTYDSRGFYLVCGRADGTITLWDAWSGKKLSSFNAHGGSVDSVAFDPQLLLFASGGSDQVVRIWDFTSNNVSLRASLTGHQGGVTSVVYSPDGESVASGSQDTTIKIWNTRSNELRSTLSGAVRAVVSLSYSPDGNFLSSTELNSNVVHIWKVLDGRFLQTLMGHTDLIFSVAYRSDGAFLVSGSKDGTVRIWNTATGALIHTLIGHIGSVYSVAYSPDGHYVASGAADGAVNIWEVELGKLGRTLRGQQSPVQSVAYSPDGSNIAASSQDGVVNIWDPTTGDLLRIFRDMEDEPGELRIGYSPDGSSLAGSSLQSMIVWDAEGRRLYRLKEESEVACSPAYSPDGRFIALLRLFWGDYSYVTIVDALTGTEFKRINLTHLDIDATSVVYSHDGLSLILTGGWRDELYILNIQKSEVITKLSGQTSGIPSPTENSIAAALGNNIVIWNMPLKEQFEWMLGEDHLSSGQLFLIYLLERLSSEGAVVSIQEIARSFITQYGTGLPDLFNLRQSYEGLSRELQDVVRHCFNVIEVG